MSLDVQMVQGFKNVFAGGEGLFMTTLVFPNSLATGHDMLLNYIMEGPKTGLEPQRCIMDIVLCVGDLNVVGKCYVS